MTTFFLKYSKLFKPYITNVSYLVLTRILSGIINLFTTILIIKFLTPLEYGLFMLTIALEQRFGLIGLPGMSFILQKSILKRNSIDYKIIQKTTVFFVLIFSILIIGFCAYNIIFVPTYPSMFSFLKDFRWDLMIIATLIILFKSPNRYENYLISSKKFKKFFYYKLFFSSFYFVIIVSAAYFLKDLKFVLIGLLLHTFVMLVISIFMINKETLEKNISLTNPIQDGFKYSALSFITFIFRFEKIILGSINPESLAILSLAEKIPNILKDIIKTLIMPKLISNGEKTDKKNFLWINKEIFYLIMYGVPLVLIIWVTIYFLYPLLFPSEYKDGENYSYLITLMLFPFFFNTVLQDFDIIQNRGAVYRKYNFCYPIIFGLVCYYTIPLYGLIGVIYAMFIKTILQVLCSIEIYLKAKKLII